MLSNTMRTCRLLRFTCGLAITCLLEVPAMDILFGQVLPPVITPKPDIVIDSAGIPRNLSFTLTSATESVRKLYPFAMPAAPIVPPGVTLQPGLVYRTIAGRQLRLDLCLPPRADSRAVPAIILIHGGGWRSGDRSMELPMALQLAGRGYVTATVEYRLSPEALYPGAMLDLKAAVRWIRAHTREYNVDTLRIAAYGCSSGGHLAALLGVTNGAPEYEEGDDAGWSSGVQAVIDIDGVLDLTTPEESGKDTVPSRPSAVKSWLGVRYADEPDLWKKASPQTHLHRGMPPMLFINSSIPRFHAGRDAAVDTMKRYGIYCEVHTIPDTPHPFWLFKPWQPEVVQHITGFLKRVFRQ
jgi:acetyl esterase/lipase